MLRPYRPLSAMSKEEITAIVKDGNFTCVHDWTNRDPSLLSYVRKQGYFESITSDLGISTARKERKSKWTIDTILAVIRSNQITTEFEWKTKSKVTWSAAKRKNIFERLCAENNIIKIEDIQANSPFDCNRRNWKKITFEVMLEHVKQLKVSSRSEFSKADLAAYAMAVKQGWLSKIASILNFESKHRDFSSPSNLLYAALKTKPLSLADWEAKDIGACNAARSRHLGKSILYMIGADNVPAHRSLLPYFIYFIQVSTADHLFIKYGITASIIARLRTHKKKVGEAGGVVALLKVFGPFSYNLAGCVESIIKTTFKPAGYLSGVDGFKTETLTVENYEAAVQLVLSSTADQANTQTSDEDEDKDEGEDKDLAVGKDEDQNLIADKDNDKDKDKNHTQATNKNHTQPKHPQTRYTPRTHQQPTHQNDHQAPENPGTAPRIHQKPPHAREKQERCVPAGCP